MTLKGATLQGVYSKSFMKNYKNKYETLHCHSKVSDGLMTYEEILNVCNSNNIGVVAFTDHDSIPNKITLKNLENLKAHPVKWVVGIEMSANKPGDFIDDFSPHIVGLFVDPFNKELVRHCEMAQEARRIRMAKIVKGLKSLGFQITERDCLKASKGEAVGRPHIVQALESQPKYPEVIEKLRRNMEEESKSNEEIKKQYDEMIRRGKSQYPYVLFLSEDAYIKGVYKSSLYRIELDKCVEIIRGAGGVSFFAHWFTEIKKCGEDKISKLLKEDRIDGVETVYGFYDDMRDDFIKQRQILQDLVKKYHKLESGGVDAHIKEHLEEFAKDEWYANMTIGLVENILSSGKVDIKWSSINK